LKTASFYWRGDDHDRRTHCGTRALLSEYERKRAIAETAGLKDKTADIAADSVGRKALKALPEMLDCIERQEWKIRVLGTWLANAYIDPGFLPEIETCGMNPPTPDDVLREAGKTIGANEVLRRQNNAGRENS